MNNDVVISGMDAMRLAQEVSKIPDGTFTIAFYQYNRVEGRCVTSLRIEKGCRIRPQLPKDKWEVDGENYFLFYDEKGSPKTCWRILLRFIGFPQDNNKLRKIKWI